MEDLTRADTAPATPAANEPLDDTLGRYQLERSIGIGGMGVVHVAFDPELQRRVALKVLRARGSTSARDWLLREARAMAQLAHPNVITVFEVGRAAGRDFVAMELVDGTLGEWLANARPSRAAIVDAFAAAGRGLAAAHAAGIVHRDFKPHNVLRSHDGRILVSDFGLARHAASPAGEASKPPEFARGSTPEILDHLTQTGLIFGTPAYMAPEQWSGDVTPATDQFAFCVALWEALAGERPFADATSETVEQRPLRDTTRIPRQLRSVLARGLDPDPQRRWATMDELLAQLAPRARSRWLVGAVLAVAVLGGVAAAVGLQDSLDIAESLTCDAPLRDPSALPAVTIVNTTTAAMFEEDIAKWRMTRTTACALGGPQQRERLRCLDGVLVRLDAVRRAAARAPELAYGDRVASRLIDPAVCLATTPPRLPLRLSNAAVQALVPHAHFDSFRQSDLLAGTGDDRCTRAIALLAHAAFERAPHPRDAADGAAVAAEACGDDRLLADALLRSLEYTINPHVTPDAMLRRVTDAVARVAQPDLDAELALARARIAQLQGDHGVALREVDGALDRAGDRRPHLRARALRLRMLLLVMRNGPGDLERAHALWAEWRDRLPPDLDGIRHELAFDDAYATWLAGDVATARARIAELVSEREVAPGHTVRGVVVDGRGRPVPHARVVADHFLFGDTAGIGLVFSPYHRPRSTFTDAGGAFVLRGVDAHATIVAQLDDRRSRPVIARAKNRLVLEPTAKIRGRIDGDRAGMLVVVTARGRGDAPTFKQMSPIAADGSFELANVLRGPAQIGLARVELASRELIALREIVVGPQGTSGIVLSPQTRRRLQIFVRSSSSGALSGGEVVVVPGRITIKSFAELEAVAPASSTRPARIDPASPSGELEAVFEHAPLGEATVCAIGFSGDLSDPAFVERMETHYDNLEVRCRPIAPDMRSAVIEVPPMRRLDD